MIKKIKTKYHKLKIKEQIIPSSKFLVKKIISKIDFENKIEILQLGFGTGIFTKYLLKQINNDSKIIVFEINKNCKKYLKKINDKKLTYIEDSAENIYKYFDNKKFDYIISTLPFATLNKNVCLKIEKQIKSHLKYQGKFLQYQYSLYSKKNIYNLFNIKPKIDFEILNFPPAFIYEVEYE